ncbi:siroheme decarboxylase subunit beta [Natrarchaeobius chitinivorans]|uniref:siroheme decarboxylase n=1 Tax=Natrarchaeobius chitinivorans TaxID=1679083 RepID=A0A3N6P3C6_NATCH|nr:Lrp/AsnC family transcriptional regulator [Natrarchaeobius chitinivorans]RQG92199.1 Lrp/AsnC family transcriptional regulator [Natrarchaeobius chitinivorans]
MHTDLDLTRRERAVVNAYQGGFPVVERPFGPAAAAMRERGVDIDATGLLETIRDLDDRGVLSRFGPLVNAQEIGGAATLVAMHAPEDRFDEIVERVNAHREVAHNYEREHPHLNVWFVVSVADETRVQAVLEEIEDETGRETYNLPKQREFRVEAKFYVDGPLSGSGTADGEDAARAGAEDRGGELERNDAAGIDCSGMGPAVTASGDSRLSPAERDLVLEIQDGLSLTETPYADVAEAIGQETDWVLETIARFDLEGKIRRIGVVPNHYALGYTENGMTVWDVPDDLVGDVGPEIASLPFVTHCYERPRHEGVWPYNFFAMTHGRSEAESERRIEQVRETMADHWNVTDEDWDSLFSTQILKKTGIRLAERADANTRSA